MTRFDEQWVDALVASAGPLDEESSPCRILFVVTDTADGKVAFYLDLDAAAPTSGTVGRLPRGESADVTVTAKEVTLLEMWAGDRDQDVVFMSGDLKVEGAYERWIDELAPLFADEPWRSAWADAAA